MTDWLADSPVMATFYCPQCEPHRDVLTEILEARYCTAHTPATAGSDDPEVAQGWISGTQECGEDNRRWCDLFHRKVQS